MEADPVNTKSWVTYTVKNHFPIENIPFGSFEHPVSHSIHSCTRVGDHVIDLAWLESEGILAENGVSWAVLKDQGKRVFDKEHLNSFIELGKDFWHETRVAIQAIFSIANKAKYEERIV